MTHVFGSNLRMFRLTVLAFFFFSLPAVSFANESIGLIGRDSTDGICIAPLMDWDGHEWKSAPGSREKPVPDARKWHEFYDGKSVREIATEKRATGACLRDKVNTPTLARFDQLKKSKLALLTTTLVHASDSSNWARSQPSATEESAVKEAFIKQFKFTRKCAKTEDFSNIVITKEKLTPQMLKLEPRSFRSKNGNFLVGVIIKDEVCISDPYVTDQFYQNHWYWIPKGQSPMEIGNNPEITFVTKAEKRTTTETRYTRRLGIVPIDAGDFAGNGQSYWMFRENGSGGGDMGSSTYFLLDATFNEVAAVGTRFYDDLENAER